MFCAECVLQVGVIGINHKSAQLEFREKVARGASSLAGEKALFFPHPTLLLSTCNRTEIYFGGSDLSLVHSDLLQWLRGSIHEPFEHRLYSYFGIDCFRHLAQVTAGLDSAIVAETEIQAQVKTAYSNACRWKTLPSCMHYVFQKALKIGKRVRNGIQMPTRGPSLLQAVWHLAGEHLDRSEANILLIGYSEMNRAMAHFLRQRGVEKFSLLTHRPSEVALEGCVALGYDAIDQWKTYDWIICASAQDRFLITGSTSKRHAIFDLSVPRNVDPEITESKGVCLYNIEQINAWIQEQKSQQTTQIVLAQALVGQEVSRLAKIYRTKTQYALDIAGRG